MNLTNLEFNIKCFPNINISIAINTETRFYNLLSNYYLDFYIPNDNISIMDKSERLFGKIKTAALLLVNHNHDLLT